MSPFVSLKKAAQEFKLSARQFRRRADPTIKPIWLNRKMFWLRKDLDYLWTVWEVKVRGRKASE